MCAFFSTQYYCSTSFAVQSFPSFFLFFRFLFPLYFTLLLFTFEDRKSASFASSHCTEVVFSSFRPLLLSPFYTSSIIPTFLSSSLLLLLTVEHYRVVVIVFQCIAWLLILFRLFPLSEVNAFSARFPNVITIPPQFATQPFLQSLISWFCSFDRPFWDTVFFFPCCRFICFGRLFAEDGFASPAFSFKFFPNLHIIWGHQIVCVVVLTFVNYNSHSLPFSFSSWLDRFRWTWPSTDLVRIHHFVLSIFCLPTQSARHFLLDFLFKRDSFAKHPSLYCL